MTQAQQTLFEIQTGKKSVRVMPTIQEIMNSNDVDNFLGFSKKAKDKKVVRVQQKQEKKNVRIDSKRATNENRRSKAESRLILADKGIKQASGAGDILNGTKGLITSLTGGTTQPREQEQTQATETAAEIRQTGEAGVSTNIIKGEQERAAKTASNDTTAPENDNSKLYLIGGAVLAAYLIFKK